MLGRARCSGFEDHLQSRLLLFTFGEGPSHLAKGSDANSDVLGGSCLFSKKMAGEERSVANKGGHVVEERFVKLVANDVHDGLERLMTAIRRHLQQT